MLPSDNFNVTSVGGAKESGDIWIKVSLFEKLSISQLQQKSILCIYQLKDIAIYQINIAINIASYLQAKKAPRVLCLPVL